MEDVLDGWESLRSPDNVYVTINLPDDSAIEVFSSVFELVELYEHVMEGKSWDTVFGSGHVLEIEPTGNQTSLRVDDLEEVREFRIDHDRLECEVRSLVQEMFHEMDEVGPDDSKESMLRRNDDIRRLYDELSA